MTEVAVSVRFLAQFCHRSGDIDLRFTPSPTGQEGTAGHQRLYRRRPASYLPEFPVDYVDAEAVGLSLRVRGRADGYDPQRGLVEEIKTCRVDPARLPVPLTRLHLAQARLYAAIIARSEDLPGLRVQLTWLRLDDDSEHPLEEDLSRGELEDFLDDTLQRYRQWLAQLEARRQRRDESLARFAFPYSEFRPGQRAMAERVYKCVHGGGRLLLEAPTGIGKTASVLYPALRALERGLHDCVVVAAARVSGRRAVEDTVAHFVQRGYRGSALTLTAKESICFSPGKACHGDDCRYARGYYDRLPAAREAALAAGQLDRAGVERLAREHTLCPWQLALDLAPWMELLVADLHHLYSLTPGLLDRLVDGGRRCTVLVDEAHNLPERARQMYAAELSRGALRQALAEAPAALRSSLRRVDRVLMALHDGTQGESWLDTPPEDLLESLQRASDAVAEQLARDAFLLQRLPALREWYFALLQCLRVQACWGGEYRLQVTRQLSGRFHQVVLRWHCLDPARLLAERHGLLHALVVFSATLSPRHWALASLGLAPDTVSWSADSPFDSEQLSVELATHIDTRYRARAGSLPDLGSLLADWLATNAGNCLLFFPSYGYLQATLADPLLQAALSSRQLWVQAPGQPAAEHAELLATLDRRRDVAAFCVLGGAFSEGIDLPGDQLSSVVIVGLGLPQLNALREQLRSHYQHQGMDGYRYAYLYPGLQKVSQALGRVIRSSSDRGSALLIDTRYAQREVRALLPPAWHYTIRND
ncbi:MAG: ATP-dependent DNA helicase [Haliea sp.]|nr:ATP-dependent DNA helicase [Haliea sp.]